MVKNLRLLATYYGIARRIGIYYKEIFVHKFNTYQQKNVTLVLLGEFQRKLLSLQNN